jgi:hypothetical protein
MLSLIQVEMGYLRCIKVPCDLNALYSFAICAKFEGTAILIVWMQALVSSEVSSSEVSYQGYTPWL